MSARLCSLRCNVFCLHEHEARWASLMEEWRNLWQLGLQGHCGTSVHMLGKQNPIFYVTSCPLCLKTEGPHQTSQWKTDSFGTIRHLNKKPHYFHSSRLHASTFMHDSTFGELQPDTPPNFLGWLFPCYNGWQIVSSCTLFQFASNSTFTTMNSTLASGHASITHRLV